MSQNNWPSPEEAKEVAVLLIYLCLAGFIGYAFWRVLFTQYWYVSSHILSFLAGAVFGLMLGDRKH